MKYFAMQADELDLIDEINSLIKAAKNRYGIELSFTEALEVIRVISLENIACTFEDIAEKLYC